MPGLRTRTYIYLRSVQDSVPFCRPNIYLSDNILNEPNTNMRPLLDFRRMKLVLSYVPDW